MATRESVLAVAAQLYAEHGWRGTTTRRIAEAAGINEVTVFRQFGSKESLLLEAIQHASAAPAEPHLPTEPVVLALELTTWAVAHHRSIATKRGLIRACLAESEERPALAPRACEGGMVAFAEAVRYLTRAHELGMIRHRESINTAASMLINTVFMDAITRDLVPQSSRRDVHTSITLQVQLILRALGATETA